MVVACNFQPTVATEGHPEREYLDVCATRGNQKKKRDKYLDEIHNTDQYLQTQYILQ